MFFKKLFGSKEEPLAAPPQQQAATAAATPTTIQPSSSASNRRNDDDDYDHFFKVSFIGNVPSKMNNLLLTYANGEYSDDDRVPYIGVDFRTKFVTMPNGDDVRLQLWDTYKYQDRISPVISPVNFRGASAVIFCYNSSDCGTFDYLKANIDKNIEYINVPEISKYIVEVTTNNSSHEKNVSQEDIQCYVDKIGAEVTSCNLNDIEAVNEFFFNVIMDIGRKKQINFGAKGRRTNNNNNSSLFTKSATPKSKPTEKKSHFFSFQKKSSSSSSSSLESSTTTQRRVTITFAPKDATPSRMYKIILIGDSLVKKTVFLLSFVNGGLPNGYISTIGVDFSVKNVKMPNGDIVELQIWDTAGQDRFGSITSSYFRGANGVFFCYNPANADTFNFIKDNIDRTLSLISEKCAVRIVGISTDNQSDKVVPESEVQAFAGRFGINASECCVDDVESVNEAFGNLIVDVGTKNNINYNP